MERNKSIYLAFTTLLICSGAFALSSESMSILSQIENVTNISLEPVFNEIVSIMSLEDVNYYNLSKAYVNTKLENYVLSYQLNETKNALNLMISELELNLNENLTSKFYELKNWTSSQLDEYSEIAYAINRIADIENRTLPLETINLQMSILETKVNNFYKDIDDKYELELNDVTKEVNWLKMQIASGNFTGNSSDIIQTKTKPLIEWWSILLIGAIAFGAIYFYKKDKKPYQPTKSIEGTNEISFSDAIKNKLKEVSKDIKGKKK